MRIRCIACVVMGLLAAAATFSEGALTAQDLSGLDEAEVMLPAASEARLRLGNLHVAYLRTGLSFVDAIGERIEVLQFYYIYYVRGDEKVVLGRIEPLKVIDAHGQVIKTARSTVHLLGISSRVLRAPLGPNCVAEGIGNEYVETDSFAYLDIDYAGETIVVQKSP